MGHYFSSFQRTTVCLKTQSSYTRRGFCDFRMSGEQPRQPKDLQGLLKFCMEATANEDAPAVPGDPAARLAAMEPEGRAGDDRHGLQLPQDWRICRHSTMP